MKQHSSPSDDTTRRPGRTTPSGTGLGFPVLTVLSHPDPRRVGERAVLHGLSEGQGVELCRHRPRFAPPGAPWDDAPLEDPYLSRKPWHLTIAEGGMVLRRVNSSTVLRLDGESVTNEAKVTEAALADGATLELAGRVALLLHRLPRGVLDRDEAADAGDSMVGASAGLARVRDAIARVADLDVPVLLRGESGTGKELVAQALHRRSRRSTAPFVAVDLGALSPALAASELFGHAKGAFTGAVSARQGFFRAAEGGTLFLDEVGEAPPEVQAMLLRALETRHVVPLGSQTPQSIDVRLVAATDSDLEARARRGDFKEPLLHRLAAYEIHLPALRQRRDDVGRLMVFFARQVLRELGDEAVLERSSSEGPPWLPADLVGRLARAPWPGNVRQLANVVRQLVIDSRGEPRLRSGPRIDAMLDDPLSGVDTSQRGVGVVEAEPVETTVGAPRRPSTLDHEEVETAMRACAFEPAAAARRLGIRRPSLYNLIRRHPRLRLCEDLADDEVRRAMTECDGDLETAAQRLEVSARALGRRIARGHRRTKP